MSDTPFEGIEDMLATGLTDGVGENGQVDIEGLWSDVQFTDLDAPSTDTGQVQEESPFAGADPVGDGVCVVCGAPTFRPPGLTASGRKKRTPKYCNLHAPHVRVQTKRPRTEGLESQSTLGQSQLENIAEELADDIRLLGTLAGPLLPVTGMYLIDRADPFTIAIVKLAKNNQRILRVLHRAATVAPIYTVAETVAGTAYAVQVDTRGADAHNMLARRLKVDRSFDSVYPQQAIVTEPTFQTPPRYEEYAGTQ